MDWPGGNPFAGLRDYLARFAAGVARPKALLVVSAHWEAEKPTVGAAVKPPLIYDYTNFPPHTYRLRYDAPGSPALAGRVSELLSASGIDSAVDERRGLDHGVFVPFRVMYPQADIPLVQLSLEAGYDPARHLAIGAALSPLRDEGVLIVGSGMSYHNLARLTDGKRTDAEEFDTWLTAAVTGAPAQRADLLKRWSDAPSARVAHPEEDHLMPLFVASGAASSERGAAVFRDLVYNKPISGYRFG
jgi:aromatic ring-opening dioxygenase catalytic subunit (LigB family)